MYKILTQINNEEIDNVIDKIIVHDQEINQNIINLNIGLLICLGIIIILIIELIETRLDVKRIEQTMLNNKEDKDKK